MPVPPAFRLLTGGTAPDGVAALRTVLAERLALRGLLPTCDGFPASAAEDREDRVASPLSLLVPIAPGEDERRVWSDLARCIIRVPARTGLILCTSGSTTGTGRLITMSAAALMVPVCATHVRLGGPGTWLLPLSTHHVAGLQILTHPLEAGTKPVMVDTSAGFSPAALAGALRSARWFIGVAASRLHVSLVPTQLVHVLQDPQAHRALAGADAVLLGGTVVGPALLTRAHGVGVTVVTIYGMSETGGGCVYSGHPLEGVEIVVQALDARGVGRILISGPALAEDHLDIPSHSPAGRPNAGGGFYRSGTRHVLATSDRGRLHPDGCLEVLGRLDDVIITGGAEVESCHVEEALTSIDGVAEVYVVGLPDAQRGSTVVAAVVLETGRGPGSPKRLDGAALCETARTRLDGVHTPKQVLILEALPLRPSGKVDRCKVARLLATITTDVISGLSMSGSRSPPQSGR